MQKYRIIGDIHGRTNWKQLVSAENDCINIFLGDYFAPYDKVSFDACMCNLQEIMELPNRVLLLGNHDLEWAFDETYSRHDYMHADYITQFFREYINEFKIAYAISPDIICTHAGVSSVWAENRIKTWTDAYNLAEKINSLFFIDPMVFNFENNAPPFDNYGEATSHSPVWIRPTSLTSSNVSCNINGESKPARQFFGHTQVKSASNVGNLYLCDCLGFTTECFEVVIDDTVTVNKITNGS